MKNLNAIIFSALLSISLQLNAQSIQVDKYVETYAGFGSSGYVDGPRGLAEFFFPAGLDVSIYNDIYIAGNPNLSIIRKITSEGIVSTYAGTGVQGFQNGNVSEAHFRYPTDVKYTASGYLYVADFGNHHIRKVSPTGEVTSVAGTNESGFKDGSKNEARFNQPYGLVVASQNTIYTTDHFNHAIRKITSNGTVTTIAGDGTEGFADGSGTQAKFYQPMGIAIDGDENLYVADARNNRIRKITPEGVVTTLAGSGVAGYVDGPGLTAAFNRPKDLEVVGNDLLVVDGFNHVIRKVSLLDGKVSTYAGNTNEATVDGFASSASFNYPLGIGVSTSGIVYVTQDHSIRKITNQTLSNFGTIEGIQSAYQELAISGSGLVEGVTVTAPLGFEISTNKLSGYSSSLSIPVTNGSFATVLYIRISSSTAEGSISGNVTLVSSGQEVKIPLTGSVKQRQAAPTIQIGTQSSYFAGSGLQGFSDGQKEIASFKTPGKIVFDGNGDMFIMDVSNSAVRKLSKEGIVSTIAGLGSTGDVNGDVSLAKFNFPTGVAVNGSGTVFIADTRNHKIKTISPEGVVSTFAGTGASGNTDGDVGTAKFYYPSDLAFDSKGNLFVADNINNCIRKIDTTGQVTTVDLGAYGVNGIEVDQNDNIYFVSTNTHQIIKLTPEGERTVVAGSSIGFVNAGGTNAKFDYPGDLAVTSDGTIFTIGANNNTVRKIDPSGAVFSLAASSSSTWGYLEGLSTKVMYDRPSAISVNQNDEIFVSDGGNNLIRKISKFTVPNMFGVEGGTAKPIQIPIITSGLLADVKVIAPEHMELKNDSYFFTPYTGDTLTISQTNGSVNFTLLVRFASTAPAGNYVDTINVITTGADTLKIPVQGLVDPNSAILYIEPTVTTLSGQTAGGFLDGNVDEALYKSPAGIVTTKDGTIYLADFSNNRVRKITTDGVVSTLAGSGVAGFVNAKGTAASFNLPLDLTLDNDENIYLLDRKNHALRKITPDGTVSTLAGDGISDLVDGEGSSARFNTPVGITFDSKEEVFYVADAGNNKIRKVTLDGVVSTLPFYVTSPTRVKMDKNGNLLVLTTHRLISLSKEGAITELFGSSSLSGDKDEYWTDARFYYPKDFELDKDGSIYLTDQFNSKIKKITPYGKVFTLAGSTVGLTNGFATGSKFNYPTALNLDNSGNLLISDANNNVLRKLSVQPLDTFIAINGNPSGAQGITFKGLNLSGDITFSAPAGFEVSTSSTTGFSQSISVTPSNLSSATVKVFIRSVGYADDYISSEYVVVTTPAAKSIYLPVVAKVDVISNIDEVQNALGMLYPNPVRDVLHLKLDENMEYNSLSIYSSTGVLEYQQAINGNEIIHVNLSFLKSGVYHVRLDGISSSTHRKVVKID